MIPSSIHANSSSANPVTRENLNEMDGVEDTGSIEIPDFIKPEFIVDKNMKRPLDPDYDPSSVHIPEEQFQKLTPLMKQYWSVKKDYYDSILLVRMAHWYTVFYYDILKLNSISSNHLRMSNVMEGFFATQKQKFIQLFTDHGFKVVVFEQTENVSYFS